MSILVNPLTEKFVGKFAGTTVKTIFRAGNKVARTIFGSSKQVNKLEVRLKPEQLLARQVKAGKFQPKRTQAYYDKLGEELKRAPIYQNPRNGNFIQCYGTQNVIVSKGGIDIVKLDNAPQGFRKITRTAIDGKPYLHGRNSVTDYFNPNRGWTSETQTTPSGILYTADRPATRTPVVPS